MARLMFSEEQRLALRAGRFEHPHPRVQLRLDVLWYISLGETNSNAARLGGVSEATVDRYVAIYRERGIEGLKQFDWQGPLTLVLDNARYQHCALVLDLAATLNIQLQFLPSYSPNLNLIERLWKFIKRDVLYGRHYKNFTEFRKAIDGCLENIPTKHRTPLATLMTHNFQQFDIASFLTA